MKSKNQLKKIAENIWQLEQQCQQNCNITENLQEMEKIAQGLDLEELLYISLYLEKKT